MRKRRIGVEVEGKNRVIEIEEPSSFKEKVLNLLCTFF